ncbi:3',5'-cyclic-nucleotide phosphodiesterase [Candidatus Binatia bacterium]|nr:3',5'-cyclic-nucleotide phosphodiesterase [Candidatus Binatia bacterium]
MPWHAVVLLVVAGLAGVASARVGSPPAFDVVVLGDAGGLAEDDLTAFLLFPAGSDIGIALDAGTLHAGIRVALAKGAFASLPLDPSGDVSAEGQVLQKHVAAYLITHPHLDHVAGLVLSSTDDTPKPIHGLPPTLDVLRDHVFNWKVWPNFTNEGVSPVLSRYALMPLASGVAHDVPGTSLRVTAFPLSHGGTGSSASTSTAFLVESDGQSLLYLGDTGPDAIEGQGRLRALWTAVAPLVRAKTLRAIFLEASYPSDHPDEKLYGHLTPRWVNAELGVLASLVDGDDPSSALRDLPVVITHVKRTLARGEAPRARIARELREANPYGVRFVLATQGEKLEL